MDIYVVGEYFYDEDGKYESYGINSVYSDWDSAISSCIDDCYFVYTKPFKLNENGKKGREIVPVVIPTLNLISNNKLEWEKWK